MARTERENDYIYKKLHAMYSRGCTLDEMYDECRGLQKWEVLDIVQTIEGRIRMKRERDMART